MWPSARTSRCTSGGSRVAECNGTPWHHDLLVLVKHNVLAALVFCVKAMNHGTVMRETETEVGGLRKETFVRGCIGGE